ncbi:hypothetical protein [Marinactinospora rubrisoli]|uniref:Uncharacterized protein n=1 Tax=Marinactinospora rubrisoli TaxID=2715399 RepID=A0ABW2KF14_9ACTN
MGENHPDPRPEGREHPEPGPRVPTRRAAPRHEELGTLGAAAELPPPPPVLREHLAHLPARIGATMPAADAPVDAPAVQAATASQDPDLGWWPRRMANAVPSHPDGEVDTRRDQPALGTDTP